MKVARNTSHNLRHDWLRFTDKNVSVSLLACRHEIHVEVTIGGKTTIDYLTPLQLANAIMVATTDPHEKP